MREPFRQDTDLSHRTDFEQFELRDHRITGDVVFELLGQTLTAHMLMRSTWPSHPKAQGIRVFACSTRKHRAQFKTNSHSLL